MLRLRLMRFWSCDASEAGHVRLMCVRSCDAFDVAVRCV